MSLLPSFRAVLKDDLSQESCDRLLDDIKKMKGVLGAHFNKGASGQSISVTHTGSPFLEDHVRKMPGVVRTQYML